MSREINFHSYICSSTEENCGEANGSTEKRLQSGNCSVLYCTYVSSHACSEVIPFKFCLVLLNIFFLLLQNHDQYIRSNHHQIRAQVSRHKQRIPQDLVPLCPLHGATTAGRQCIPQPPHLLVCWNNFQSGPQQIPP